uniref:Uncharacterized protein n=1 Tax=Buteo japonicus TaxID=224669 RepID=A0A8C0BME6_9AVES
MNIFGHCPAHDEFYLVVCNHCSQVVKPQAFQKHCGEPGRWGGSGHGYPPTTTSPPASGGTGEGSCAGRAQGWGAHGSGTLGVG